jgi:hypothetical protein
MTTILLLLILGQAGGQAPDAAVGPAEAPKRAAITIQEVDAPGARVFHLNMPWGPETFAAMERPGEGFYNRRSWPFARLETSEALRIGETALSEGNYALVLHPNGPEDEGMSLEVRKIAPGEFLQDGNVMTRTPEGETIWRAPVTFETVNATVPALEIALAPRAEGLLLAVRYGNRRTQQLLETP